MTFLLYLYIGSSLLLAALSIPLMLRKIPPNSWYGFRIPKTLNNPEIWYPVNECTGRWLLVTGILELLAAVGLYFIPGISIDAYALGVLAILCLAFAFSLIQAIRLLRQF